MRLKFLHIFITVLLLSIPYRVFADQRDSATASPLQLGIAIGFGQQQTPYIANEDKSFYAFLDLAYYGAYGFFDNGDIGAYLYTGQNSSLSLIAARKNERTLFEPINHLTRGINISGSTTASNIELNSSGNSDTDSPTINNGQVPEPQADAEDIIIPPRETSIDAGLEYLLENRWGIWQSQLSKDISGTHNGYELWLSYSNEHAISSGVFSYSLGISTKSKAYVDYYYGITATESNEQLPEYHADRSNNWTVKLAYSYPLSKKTSLSSFIKHEKLGSSIQRSPIVNTSSLNTVFIGLYYRFF